jgi:hypothetical protein
MRWTVGEWCRVVSMAAATAMAGGAFAGCAQDTGLVPAPQAAVVPGSARLAYAQQGDIAMWVDGDAWRGDPRDLEDVMAPIWVRLDNRGRRPVRVMYKDLGLELPSRVRVTPLPPFSMRTQGPLRVSAVRAPAFHHHGFYVAPGYGFYYPGVRPWHRPLPYDPFFYDTYYARWRVPLPTEDMLRGALPEGVLEPGGSVSGFLYFPDIPKDAQGVFTFEAKLPDETAGNYVARLDVPLMPK